MADKRILAFDGSTITAQRWNRGFVTTDQIFAADTLGYEAFSAYLANAKDALIYVLADVSEEGFQLETIPAVQGGDREALIKRRLGQFFFGTPYSLGHSLGRQKEGRRDERVLFAALTRPEVLSPWLELIHQAERPLAGIYSVPLVLAENSKSIVSGHQQFLLVTLAASGLRHTFFSEGQIQFSRLSQLTTHSQDEFAISCAREATRTYQYLLGQRLIARNASLPTIVVAHSSDHVKLGKQFVDTDKLNFELLGLDTLATKLGLKTPIPDSHCDPLFAHQLITHTPKAQFAPASDRKLYRLSQIRSGFRVAAVAILFGCLLAAGRFGLQWNDLHDNTVITNMQAAADSRRHEALLNELPKIKLTPDNLRAVIARYQEIMQRSNGPTPLLAHLSNVLETMPSISLQRLDWALGDRTNSAIGANSGAQLSVTSPASAPIGSGAGKVTTLLEVTAVLPIIVASDQRLQLEMVESLVTRLRTNGVDAVIVTSPVDIESGKALKRGSSDTERPSGPPAFKIRLTSTQ
jgi:hypothetical protein